jgi:UDP-2-acetamido-2,6-beta-L-arabino-hexul-4-ose reductase
VFHGEARIQVRRLFHSHVHEFRVTGDTPSYVDIPTLHTHSITNTARGELLTLFWAHEIFDPSRPDTVGASADVVGASEGT